LVVQEAAEMMASSLDRVFSFTLYTMVLQVVARGCGNNNLLSAGINMSLALILRGVETGAFQNYVYADLPQGRFLALSPHRS